MFFPVAFKIHKIAQSMTGIFAGKEELLCLAGRVGIKAHFVGHEAVIVAVDEEYRHIAVFHGFQRAFAANVKAAEYYSAQSYEGENKLGIVLLFHNMADYLLGA